MINIVTLGDDEKYMVDVGFGNNGPTHPLPLVHGVVSQRIAPQELRLVKQGIPENEDRDQKLWIYQWRANPEDEWTSMYCFTEVEFLAQDYEMMNFWTSQNRKSWFTRQIVVTKMIMGNEVLDGTLKPLIGTVSLSGGEVKRRIGESTEKLICGTEDERIEALKAEFGIELVEHERRGIKGLVTELLP